MSDQRQHSARKHCNFVSRKVSRKQAKQASRARRMGKHQKQTDDCELVLEGGNANCQKHATVRLALADDFKPKIKRLSYI